MKILGGLFPTPKPQNVFAMPDDPEGFIADLSKRRFWREIDPALLAEIAGNAKGLAEMTGDAEAKFLKGFVFVSDAHDLAQNSFLPAARDRDPYEPPLISFALALYSLGSSLSAVAESLTNIEELR